MKQKTVAGIFQITILFAFIGGMLLNYFLLGPVINSGETLRLIDEIDRYVREFYPEQDFNPYDRKQVDSLISMKHDPYEAGFLVIMDGNADIVYSQGGESGDGRIMLRNKYGDLATFLVDREIENPEVLDCMEYNTTTRTSMFARYLPLHDLLYFYGVNYLEAGGSALLRNYVILFIVLAFGGLLIVIVGFNTYKRLSLDEQKEMLVQQELDTAALIQRAMLPSGEKHLMQIDVDARLVPAQKVAGDFFVYLLRDGLLYFCIGDVSGKGVPASLFMSKAVTLFRGYSNSRLSPAEIADGLNSELCSGNDQNMFLTGILGTIRVIDGYVTYVNAGHEPPLYWNGRDDSKMGFIDSTGNIPFGIVPEMSYCEEYFEIDKNGLLLLYTDGVSEAKSLKGELLGRSVLPGLLDSYKKSSAKELNDRIIERIARFEAGTEQNDDITLLTFRASAVPKRLVLKNEIPELRKIRQFTQEVFDECPIDNKERNLIRSGLDEALTNCVNYAYDQPGGIIEVAAGIEEGHLCFTVTDSGKHFNPLEYNPAPDGEQLKIGGLGISMFKKVFDKILYERVGNRNILKLFKKI